MTAGVVCSLTLARFPRRKDTTGFLLRDAPRFERKWFNSQAKGGLVHRTDGLKKETRGIATIKIGKTRSNNTGPAAHTQNASALRRCQTTGQERQHPNAVWLCTKPTAGAHRRKNRRNLKRKKKSFGFNVGGKAEQQNGDRPWLRAATTTAAASLPPP